MPNHVSQRLTISATEEILQKIKEATRYIAEQSNGDRIEFAFSEAAFFPMPEALRGTISGSNAVVSDEEYAAFMADQERVDQHKKMGCGMPITQAMADELRSKYGYINWYDWAVENWGTKWGVYDVAQAWSHDEGSISITFQSAWSPASRIVERLSQLFPSATFRLDYIDEGWNFAGHDIINDGSTLETESVECDRENSEFVSLAELVGYTIYDEDED